MPEKNLTDFDPENPPETGTLFKAAQYNDENAPIIEFRGLNEVRVAAGHPGDPNAGAIAGGGDVDVGSVMQHELVFRTHRPGGFWSDGETKRIGEQAFEGRSDLVVVEE